MRCTSIVVTYDGRRQRRNLALCWLVLILLWEARLEVGSQVACGWPSRHVLERAVVTVPRSLALDRARWSHIRYRLRRTR